MQIIENFAPSATEAAVAELSKRNSGKTKSIEFSAQISPQTAPTHIQINWVDNTSTVRTKNAIRSLAMSGSVAQPSLPPDLTSKSIPSPTFSSSDLIYQLPVHSVLPDELIAQVKDIYPGLVMVEAKCIEAVSKRIHAMHQKDTKPLNNDQWQALVSLHESLLYEHYDFFLVTQHPNATESINKLATKYKMPARLWEHGIRRFLELLRGCLPASHEHMLRFIYIAYSAVSLLFETTSAFTDIWIECLGDLARYRTAIACDLDNHNKQCGCESTWIRTSKYWYSKGVNRQPHLGRLHHHLAVVTDSDILQQLFLYYKALAVTQQYPIAGKTIFKSINLIQGGNKSMKDVFTSLHSMFYTATNRNAFTQKKNECLKLLGNEVATSRLEFKIPGAYIAICGIASLFQYNTKDGRTKLATARENKRATTDSEAKHTPPSEFINNSYEPNAPFIQPPKLNPKSRDVSLIYAQELAFEILSMFLRGYDPAVQPHIHIWLVFLNYLKHYPKGMDIPFEKFPWEEMAKYGTALLERNQGNKAVLEGVQNSEIFPASSPLPEEYLMSGLEITQGYFPGNYFDEIVDDDKRLIELPSATAIREEKMLWLMIKFANYGSWIQFDPIEYKFNVSSELTETLKL
ncbi:hypothetical protein EYR41_006113 [Orbilia oligospora]|uniref:DNA/RNA-binding domain-containing protein n=1 Tax=Orbilia oligospora TaxID=2813651 RepID=A0A8H2HT07_ORBOL|nr:hypothetical protein EYR41_006113 [Orbilia oligospora]